MDKLIHILPLSKNAYYMKEEIVFGSFSSNSDEEYKFVKLEPSVKAKETSIKND